MSFVFYMHFCIPYGSFFIHSVSFSISGVNSIVCDMVFMDILATTANLSTENLYILIAFTCDLVRITLKIQNERYYFYSLDLTYL